MHDYDELRRNIEMAIESLEALEGTETPAEAISGSAEGTALPAQFEVETLTALSTGLRASLVLAESSLGECQKAIPFSPMHPVLKPDETEVQWCCNHNPPHCGGE